jgi:hypothetical protein
MPPKRIRRLAKRLALLLLAAVCLFLLAVAVFAVRCRSLETQLPPVRQGSNPQTYSRPAEDTFFSYPEWYIVWSYQEKADFQEKHLQSGFPFFGAIAQYWSNYCCAYAATRGRYPFNFGDHIMLVVIGSSFSIEYAIRGVYENTIGRLTEWMSSYEPVEEDRYAYKVAREYADFVHIRPFYEFSFWKELKGLWRDTNLFGRHPLRKFERRVFLTLDYGIESFYCWLIEKGTHATYGIESAETYASIENASGETLTQFPRIRIVKLAGLQSFLVIIPRYQEFTTIASELAKRDVHFREIAGNDEILLSALVPQDWTYDLPEGRFLFSNGILTQPATKRIAVWTPVASLHTVLNSLAQRGAKLEHIYDY